MHYLLFTNYLLKEELVSNLHFVIKALKLTVYVLTLEKKPIRSVIHILRLWEITIIVISVPVLFGLRFIIGYIYKGILKRCDILAVKLHKDANVTQLIDIYGFYLKMLKYNTHKHCNMSYILRLKRC